MRWTTRLLRSTVLPGSGCTSERRTSTLMRRVMPKLCKMPPSSRTMTGLCVNQSSQEAQLTDPKGPPKKPAHLHRSRMPSCGASLELGASQTTYLGTRFSMAGDAGTGGAGGAGVAWAGFSAALTFSIASLVGDMISPSERSPADMQRVGGEGVAVGDCMEREREREEEPPLGSSCCCCSCSTSSSCTSESPL